MNIPNAVPSAPEGQGYPDTLQQKYLLLSCHKLCQEFLNQGIINTLAATIETLQEIMADCPDVHLKTIYHDGVRELQVKQQALLQAYPAALSHYYYRDLKPDGWDAYGQLGNAVASPRYELESGALESRILLEQQIVDMQNRYQSPLLNLAELTNSLLGKELISSKLPFSPARFAYAFRDAANVMKLPGQIRLQLYRQWGRQVCQGLTPLYEKLQGYLKQELEAPYSCDLLPQQKASFNRTTAQLTSMVQNLAQDTPEREQSRQQLVEQQLQRAREVVDGELSQRLAGLKLTAGLNDLLHGPWRELLAQNYLQQGFDSPGWNTSLMITDDLIWSISPKQSAEERKQLAAMIPSLIKALRESLEELNWDDIDFDSIFRELETRHIANLRGGAANDDAPPERKPQAALFCKLPEGMILSDEPEEEIVIDASMVPWSHEGRLD